MGASTGAGPTVGAPTERFPRTMPTSVVTGGAGFLGSHLCDALLERGDRVLCVDNLDTGSLTNIEHLRRDDFVFVQHDLVTHLEIDESVDNVFHLASPGKPDRLPAPAAAHAEGRRVRHAQRARARQAPSCALPDRVDERGLRRSARPPAARELLGQRQPDRPARRVRRGEALRRGDDHGLPPPAGRRHRRSCASSTPTARACAPTTDGRSRPSCARRSRASRSRCSATAARRAASATSPT